MTPNPVVFPELDDNVAAYEKARDQGTPPSLAEFLPPQNHSLYKSVLSELIRVEMELNWREGRSSSLQDYLETYPVLQRDPQTLQELAYEDYRLRLLAGQSPSSEEYARRFGINTSNWFVPSPSSRPDVIAKTKIVDRPRGYVGFEQPSDFPEPGQSLAGFKLLRELGRGSFGRVYLAQQQELSGRPVALKLSPSFFVDEAHTLARLQHTHCADLFAAQDR